MHVGDIGIVGFICKTPLTQLAVAEPLKPGTVFAVGGLVWPHPTPLNEASHWLLLPHVSVCVAHTAQDMGSPGGGVGPQGPQLYPAEGSSATTPLVHFTVALDQGSAGVVLLTWSVAKLIIAPTVVAH